VYVKYIFKAERAIGRTEQNELFEVKSSQVLDKSRPHDLSLPMPPHALSRVPHDHRQIRKGFSFPPPAIAGQPGAKSCTVRTENVLSRWGFAVSSWPKQ